MRVAPFVGVWIEINVTEYGIKESSVAPFVGVWIEINLRFPSEEGLDVAPFVGVWIEIPLCVMCALYSFRRSLCGSVD